MVWEPIVTMGPFLGSLCLPRPDIAMGNPEELHPRTCPWKAPGSFGRFCSPCEGANFDGTKFSSKKIGPWSETCLRTCWFEYITFANYLYCEWSFKRIIPTTKNNIYVCYYIVCGLRLRSHHDSAWQFRHVKVCTQTSCWVEVGYALQVHLRVVSTFRGPPYVFRGFRLPFSFAGPFPTASSLSPLPHHLYFLQTTKSSPLSVA